MFSSELIEKYAKSNHFGALIGMHCEIPEAGKVHYYITIEDKHLATPIAAHGGVIASLMDAALGVACLSAVVNDNKVVFLRAGLNNIQEVKEQNNIVVQTAQPNFGVGVKIFNISTK